MRFLALCALKDLRRMWRDPAALAMWVGIPLLAAVLMYLVFGRGGVTPRGRLLVADEDGTLLSSLLAGAFSQQQLGEMLVVERVSSNAGRVRLQRGDGSALLIVPKGFTSDFLNHRPCQLKLVKNPSQRILPEIIEEVTSVLADAGTYLHALLGEQLRLFAQGPPGGTATFPDQTVAAMSMEFNRIGARLARYLNPPVIELESQVIEQENPVRASFAAVMYPGMLFMAILFLVLGLSGDLWHEREEGTLRRLLGTPARLSGFLGGKALSAAVVFLLVGAASLALAHWLLKMPVHSPALAVLWMALAGVAFLLLMMLLQLFATNQRAANLLSFLVVFPLIMLGGSFFPLEAMPGWLASVGRLTPSGYAVTQLRLLLAGEAQPGPLAAGFGAAVATAALAFLLVLWRLRRVSVA